MIITKTTTSPNKSGRGCLSVPFILLYVFGIFSFFIFQNHSLYFKCIHCRRLGFLAWNPYQLRCWSPHSFPVPSSHYYCNAYQWIIRPSILFAHLRDTVMPNTCGYEHWVTRDFTKVIVVRPHNRPLQDRTTPKNANVYVFYLEHPLHFASNSIYTSSNTV